MNHNKEALDWIDNHIKEEIREWAKDNLEPGVIDMMMHMPDNVTIKTVDHYDQEKKAAIESHNSKDKESGDIKIVL